MESCSVTRDCKKVLSKIEARYFCCNFLYAAILNEISNSCMCIETDCFIPLNSKVELMIPLKKNVLSVPVRVKGHLRTAHKHDVMSVEILRPSKTYLEFVNTF
jgi:hypothetical protein